MAIATREALGTRATRIILGRGAVAYPRQALLWAVAVLGAALLALVLLTRPWAGAPTAPGTRGVAPADLTEQLSRHAYGPSGQEVTLLWATPRYLQATHQTTAAARFDPARDLVFFQLEHMHTGDLGAPLRPTLRMPGMSMAPIRAVTTLDSPHHRFTVLAYRRMGAFQLAVPAAKAGMPPTLLSWRAANAAGSAGSASLRFTWATMLALFGGLLSSMWPCLFQLSIYFVPTLAGLRAADPSGERPAAANLRVMKAAGAFALGFVIVYTAAGAAAGFAAQSLGGTTAFWQFRRELTLVAGIVLLLTALRLAANGRAPLVCKMPLGNFLRRKRIGTLGTMLLGICFAVGCTTCFGAAIVLGMITYVGVAGTPLTGALIMLVFALGMAIPLLLGSLLMARIVSQLGRMERLAPYMVLGAAAVMAGFAVLLISGHSMFVSNLVARAP